MTGGGGARPYPIERTLGDPLYGKTVNYHYLLVEVNRGKALVTMKRVEWENGRAMWTQPDSVQIATHSVPSAKAAGANSKAARR